MNEELKQEFEELKNKVNDIMGEIDSISSHYDKVEEEKEWPQKLDRYIYLNDQGIRVITLYENDDEDRRRKNIGNMYKPEVTVDIQGESEEKIEWLEAVQKVKTYIRQEFGEYEFSYGEFNCTIYRQFNKNSSELRWSCSSTEKHYSPIGYLRSENDADRLLEECKEDLEIIFK